MSDDAVDNAVKQHYQRQVLAPKTLKRMEAMAENRQNKQNACFWRKRWQLQRNLFLAASFIITILLVPFLWPGDESQLSKVAREVALNHNKQLTSDYITDSYQNLVLLMKKLDFVPVSPALLKQSGYQVIGARYCSIQGHIAAQIKLITRHGDELTLYQTRLNHKLALLDGQYYTVNKVQVRTWQEGRIFFSLAQTSK